MGIRFTTGIIKRTFFNKRHARSNKKKLNDIREKAFFYSVFCRLLLVSINTYSIWHTLGMVQIIQVKTLIVSITD